MTIQMFAKRLNESGIHRGLLRVVSGLGIGVIMSLLTSGEAKCQIVAISQFGGSRHENFDSLDNYLQSATPSVLNIFADGSTLAGGNLQVYTTGASNISLGTAGSAGVNTGPNGVDNAVNSGTMTITFGTAVKQFGAFFGAKTSAGDDPTTVTLSFYDTSNHMIGSAQ